MLINKHQGKSRSKCFNFYFFKNNLDYHGGEQINALEVRGTDIWVITIIT